MVFLFFNMLLLKANLLLKLFILAFYLKCVMLHLLLEFEKFLLCHEFNFGDILLHQFHTYFQFLLPFLQSFIFLSQHLVIFPKFKNLISFIPDLCATLTSLLSQMLKLFINITFLLPQLLVLCFQVFQLGFIGVTLIFHYWKILIQI